jgi:pimeloyl-ACP methyl ester carboxylesterase
VEKLPYLALDDIKMYYIIAGEGQPIALIHGAVLNIGTNWSGQIPVFSRNFKVIAMDLRGHGRTNNPSGILDHNTMAEDVASLLEKLHIGKTNLVGFSRGGTLAIRIALSHPELVNTLTICSSGYYVSKEGLNLFHKNMDPKTMEESGSEWVAFYRRIHRTNGIDYWKQLINQLRKSPKRKISLAELSRINVPTLIVVGDKDPYGFTQQAIEIHEALKDSELAVLPNTGHWVPEKKARRFNETVMDFLKRRSNQT